MNDAGEADVHYRRVTDTLHVAFFGFGRPTIGHPLGGGNVVLRLDARTQEVVGVEVTHLSSIGLRPHRDLPSWFQALCFYAMVGAACVGAAWLAWRAFA